MGVEPVSSAAAVGVVGVLAEGVVVVGVVEEVVVGALGVVVESVVEAWEGVVASMVVEEEVVGIRHKVVALGERIRQMHFEEVVARE